MTDIKELQRRITAAMDRVAQGLEKVEAAPHVDPEIAQALEDERTANEQLTERVRMLKAKSDAEIASLQGQVEAGQAHMAQFDVTLQRLRQANAQLTEACAALIDANQEGVGEPHLINKAMAAELEALRAARAAEIAESDAILGALSPLLAGDQHPAAPEEGH